MARTNFPTFSSFFVLIGLTTILFTIAAPKATATRLIPIPPGANQLGAKVFAIFACSDTGNTITPTEPYLNSPLSPESPVSLICTSDGANKTIAEGKTATFGFTKITAAPGSMAGVSLPGSSLKKVPCYLVVTPTNCPRLNGKTVTSQLLLVGVKSRANPAVLILQGLPSTAA